MERVVEATNDCNSDIDEFVYDENRLTKAISSFDTNISYNRILFGNIHGSKFSFSLFVFVKIAYTVNSFAQLYFLDHFIGDRSLFFGVEVLSKMWHGESLSELMIFPRETICNFNISQNGIDKQYSVC